MHSWLRLLGMSRSPASSWLRRSAAAILFVALLAAAAGSMRAAGGYPVSIVDDGRRHRDSARTCKDRVSCAQQY